jgi:hypothetical protein
MMETKLREQLRACAKAYGDNAKLGVSTVAKRFIGDSRFFDKEGSFRVATFDLMVARFALDWPKGVSWPADIERPSPQAARATVARLSK